MFNSTTLTELCRMHELNRLDGIMGDDGSDRIVGTWLMTIIH